MKKQTCLITPERYAKAKAEWESILEMRALQIAAEVEEGKTQQAVADRWGINFSLVSRIVKRVKEGKVED